MMGIPDYLNTTSPSALNIKLDDAQLVAILAAMLLGDGGKSECPAWSSWRTGDRYSAVDAASELVRLVRERVAV